MTDVPDRVRELAAERDARRAAKDFGAADALRDEIASLGYRIVDGADGPSFEPVAPAEPATGRRVPAGDVESVLGEPATLDASVHWVDEGWPQDIRRAVAAFRAHPIEHDVQFVVADVTGAGAGEDYGDDVEVLRLAPGTGWASARNAGLRRSRGRIVLAMDGSIEPTGDVLGPLVSALGDPAVGICGPFGISTRDLRSFTESRGPDVDAIEGYLMALRRELLTEIGPFDERFRWYRTADIELSFRAKEAGYRCLVVDVPVRRHDHRAWSAASEEERERWSKRNFYRFLDRFRGRTDLLVDPAGE